MIARKRFTKKLFRAVQWRGDYKAVVKQLLHDGELIVDGSNPCKYNHYMVRPLAARNTPGTPVMRLSPLMFWLKFVETPYGDD